MPLNRQLLFAFWDYIKIKFRLDVGVVSPLTLASDKHLSYNILERKSKRIKLVNQENEILKHRTFSTKQKITKKKMDLTICVFTFQFLDGNVGDVLAVYSLVSDNFAPSTLLVLILFLPCSVDNAKQHDTPEYQR